MSPLEKFSLSLGCESNLSVGRTLQSSPGVCVCPSLPPSAPLHLSTPAVSHLRADMLRVAALVSLLCSAALADVLFRCPRCTAERQAACTPPAEPCAEMVREPGCGCCAACARLEGEHCGVYTPRCAAGLRCYPLPGTELPLEQLVRGMGTCSRRADGEREVGPEHRELSAEVPDPSEASLTDIPSLRKPNKDGPWIDPKRSAVRQWKLDLKSRMKYSKEEDTRSCVQLSQCQLELEQVLERISKMPFSENRGPLEDLYALHLPNCDKRGQYNLKQCKMSVRGQRGECWCVDPHTGRQIPTSPVLRGDPNCTQYLDALEVDPVGMLQK